MSHQPSTKPDTVSAPGADPQASAAAPAARRVLVVDDNLDAAEGLAMLLQLKGHQVATAYDGEGAIDAAREFDPQVVLLDIGLPRLDGYTVARRIRDAGGPGLLLIALTGYGQKEDRVRAAAAGFDYHFVKPADPREIQAAIERGRNTAGEPALEVHRLGASRPE